MRKEIIQYVYEMSNHFVRLFPCSSMSDTAIADEIRSSHFHRELETHRPIVDDNTSNRARFAIIGMNQSRRDYPRLESTVSPAALLVTGAVVVTFLTSTRTYM